MEIKLQDKVTNQCPTTEDKIACSECRLECKLRMETKDNDEVKIPPESLLNIIYY